MRNALSSVQDADADIHYNLNPFFIFRSSAMASTGSVLPVALCTSGSYLRQQPTIHTSRG